MIEKDPGLIEDQQGRPPVEPLFEPVEQIGQHRRDDARLPHQRLGLEALHIGDGEVVLRSEEHTSELQSLMRISYAVFCLKKKKITKHDDLHLTKQTQKNTTDIKQTS